MDRCIYDKLRESFPIEKEKDLVKILVEKWRNDRKSIHIYKEKLPDKKIFPIYNSTGVIAGDWPGFSEAVLGTVHERGWNINFASGISLEEEGSQLGIILFVIKLDNEAALEKYLIDREDIVRNIRSISIGSLAKRLLLTIESKRLEVYSQVVDVIEKNAKNEYLKDLLGPEGEAFMFFASRSKAYITERKPGDLATQIIDNYVIQNDVMNSKGDIQIYIENLKTSKENLTGISVGVLEKDMLLKEILDAISYVLPDVKIVYNKEFTNPDGVLVARIEISDEEGNPYPVEIHKRIKNVLYRLHSKARSESGRIIETTGGFEHYIRAIIPQLVREFNNSNSPQVFFSVMNSAEFFIEFKIFIVTDNENKERKLSQLMEGFERIDGITLLSTHPPRIFINAIVFVYDVRGDLDKFESSSEIYDKIKQVIEKVIGKFRDFDEGLRKIDNMKILSIIEELSDINGKEVKRIYYNLEDFWRMNASVADTVKVIRLVNETYSEYSKEKRIVNDVKLSTGNALIIAFPTDESIVNKVLKILKGCEITFSVMERTKANIMILHVSIGGKPLKADKIKKIISHIKY